MAGGALMAVKARIMTKIAKTCCGQQVSLRLFHFRSSLLLSASLCARPLGAASYCRRSLGWVLVARWHTQFVTEQSHLGVVHPAFYELPGILFSPAQ